MATHTRSLHKGTEDLLLDHYLEVLVRKPGALAGSTALAAARASGAFTSAHQRFWDAARRVCISETRSIGRLVRWRIPGVRTNQTFMEMFRAYPFTVLDEGEAHSISGLCGKIWTLARDYPRLGGPDDFRNWAEPGTVRVLFAHWVQPADGGAELFSEAVVTPFHDYIEHYVARWSQQPPGTLEPQAALRQFYSELLDLLDRDRQLVVALSAARAFEDPDGKILHVNNM